METEQKPETDQSDKDAEKQRPLCIVSDVVNWCSFEENSVAVPQQIKHRVIT